MYKRAYRMVFLIMTFEGAERLSFCYVKGSMIVTSILMNGNIKAIFPNRFYVIMEGNKAFKI